MENGFPIIQLHGSAHERGVRYGTEAEKLIQKGLLLYKNDFAKRGLDWSTSLHIARRYIDIVREFEPTFAEELDGIASGAKVTNDEIMLLNARTEIMYAAPSSNALPVPTDGCTSALATPGVTANGHMLHGQNWDWRVECTETSVVLQIQSEDGPDILTFCEAGQFARHGLNSFGVGLTANGLETDNENQGVTVPTPFVRRKMLMAKSLASAAGVVLNVPRSTSHNITLSQCDGEAYNFETTPARVFWSLPENGILTHANHFKDQVARQMVVDNGLLRHPETLYRDSRVAAHLQSDIGQIDVDTFKRAFADSYGSPDAVCRSPAPRIDGFNSATIATLIMDTTSRQMWIAAAPFNGCNFKEYSLRDD